MKANATRPAAFPMTDGTNLSRTLLSTPLPGTPTPTL